MASAHLVQGQWAKEAWLFMNAGLRDPALTHRAGASLSGSAGLPWWRLLSCSCGLPLEPAVMLELRDGEGGSVQVPADVRELQVILDSVGLLRENHLRSLC